MAIKRDGGGYRLGAKSGNGRPTKVSGWERVFSFGKVSITGRMVYGFVYRKRTDVWEAGNTYTSMDYATKKELFNLRLRGNA